MANKFYEYAEVDGHVLLIELTYPHCPTVGADEAFLIYAENRNQAFQLAMDHLFRNRPLQKFYGTYQDDAYYGEVECVM